MNVLSGGILEAADKVPGVPAKNEGLIFETNDE